MSSLSPTPARAPIPAPVREGRLVAIGRRLASDRTDAVAGALADAGVRAFEITLNEPEADALLAIGIAARRHGDRMLVGAGTVRSIPAARRAIDAGATFLVAPHTDEALIRWAAGRGIPIFPVGFTPTEVHRAWEAGATAVKLFPATVGGPGYLRELAGPFPEIPIIPTGGVSAENVAAFLAAGAVAVGLGGRLIGDGDPAGVRERAAAVIAAIAAAGPGA